MNALRNPTKKTCTGQQCSPKERHGGLHARMNEQQTAPTQAERGRRVTMGTAMRPWLRSEDGQAATRTREQHQCPVQVDSCCAAWHTERRGVELFRIRHNHHPHADSDDTTARRRFPAGGIGTKPARTAVRPNGRAPGPPPGSVTGGGSRRFTLRKVYCQSINTQQVAETETGPDRRKSAAQKLAPTPR